jgi:hypothetical protein
MQKDHQNEIRSMTNNKNKEIENSKKIINDLKNKLQNLQKRNYMNNMNISQRIKNSKNESNFGNNIERMGLLEQNSEKLSRNNYERKRENKYFRNEIEGMSTNLKYKNDIIKSSPQIIDLIEVGDYVNGKKVIDVYSDYIFDYSEEFRVIRFSETDILHNSKHIETIVTHEQMEAMQYRVEE